MILPHTVISLRTKKIVQFIGRTNLKSDRKSFLRVVRSSIFGLLIFLISNDLSAGVGRDTTNTFNPYFLSNHPLTIFFSRINHQFNCQPELRRTFQFTWSRGNVWLPFAQAKLANQSEDQQALSSKVWHERNYMFSQRNIDDFETRTLEADGLFSTYYFQWREPINGYIDVGLNFRFGSLSAGSVPYSLLTSDSFIEWFHSNVIGGEDPFGRKTRPYDLAELYYEDEEGNTLYLRDNDFFLGELSADWNLYLPRILGGMVPSVTLNTGISRLRSTYLFNPGISGTLIKRHYVDLNYWETGLSSGVLFPALFQELPVEINNNRYIASLAVNLVYAIQLEQSSWILGVNYHLQSALMKAKEKEYYVIESLGISSHGHYAMSHLHRPLQGWSFALTYKRGKAAISAFLREDALVDNAPDVQVGWSLFYRL